jgi:hypothetical protein
VGASFLKFASTHSRNIVKVKVGFLDRLAMVALRIRQAEETLLEEVTATCKLIYSL